jgi:hypothetical protein
MNQAPQIAPGGRAGGTVADLVASRLDDIILARLATVRKPASPAGLARELRQLAPAAFSDARWFAAVEQSLSRLRDRDAVDGRGRPVARAQLGQLGLRSAGPWRKLYQQILPGLGLGIAAADSRIRGQLDGHDGWAAAVVARARGFWRDGSPPPCTAVCDTLVWRSLGLPGNPKKTPPEIRTHFLAQELGRPDSPPVRLLRHLAARDVGAVRPDLRGLREALARRWLAAASWQVAGGPEQVGTDRSRPSAPADRLSELAAAVRDAAARAREGVFGRTMVFIASLWRTLQSHPAVAGLSLDEFKHRLVAANRAGLLVLARADLVAAMDPRDVSESEIRHLEASYHFVEREAAP